MKKGIFILLGIMAFNTAFAATHRGFHKRTHNRQALTSEEQAFFVQLGNDQRRIFAFMSNEQRKAALLAAKNTATADAAIEQVMQEQNLALIDGELKVNK